MKATISSQTITLGNSYWKHYPDGTWQTLMYGSFPNQGCSGLVYRWSWIDSSKVPKEVKELLK